MSTRTRISGRLIAVLVLAGAVLLAIILASGGGFPGSSSAPGRQSTSPPATTTGQVRGAVTVKVMHLKGHTWQFRYIVRNTGTVPIAGFQLTSPQANLFHISGQSNWSYYGSGVCGGKHADLLIYWSTATKSRRVIRPKHTAQFAFRVNTTGARKMLYSLSWDAAAPQFGPITGPAASSLQTSGPCGR